MKNNERGNVLFYILIAVALLAALTFAISQSTRGNVQQVSEEKARIYATELIEYANNIANAVAQLRLRNIDIDELCFDHTNWGASDYDHGGCTDDIHKIFHPKGGGIAWSTAQPLAMDTSATPDNLWHIYGDNEIKRIGTTCGAADCADLVLYVDELNSTVCSQINKLLGLTATSDPIPTDTNMGTTRYVGTFSYSFTIADEVGGAALEGQRAGCFQKTTAPAKYVFYRVLLAR